MIRTLINWNVGTTGGMSLFLIGLLLHHSWNQDVLGRWSWSYVLFIAVVAFVLLGLIARTWVSLARQDRREHFPDTSQILCQVAALLWGAGYVLNALDAPSNGGQILDLNLFGSTQPVATLTLWLSMATLALYLGEPLVRKGLHSRWGTALLTIWVTLALLVLIEGGLRVWAILAPTTQGFPTYTEAMWLRKYVVLNQVGFRDNDHPLVSLSNKNRLLVVGDSFAFGVGLSRVEDRFGERLVKLLNQRTNSEWELINASQPDTHTLTHIEFLTRSLELKPQVVILLYVFNDIDYLSQVTSRSALAGSPESFLERIDPRRIGFKNLFLFQEVYVRLRLISFSSSSNQAMVKDGYLDEGLLLAHMRDLQTFYSLAASSGSVTAIVPYETGIMVNPLAAQRHDRFVFAGTHAGLPIWSVSSKAFSGHRFDELTVNNLDRHPNAFANQLLANSVIDQLVTELISSLAANR